MTQEATPAPRKRGRPPSGRAKSDAERARAYRNRQAGAEVKVLAQLCGFILSRHLDEALVAFQANPEGYSPATREWEESSREATRLQLAAHHVRLLNLWNHPSRQEGANARKVMGEALRMAEAWPEEWKLALEAGGLPEVQARFAQAQEAKS